MREPLWRPSPERARHSKIAAFMRAAEAEWGVRLPDYESLHRWSVEQPSAFWASVWQACGVVGERGSILARVARFRRADAAGQQNGSSPRPRE